MTTDYTQQRNFIAHYADCYNADRCKRVKLTPQMMDKMYNFLSNATIDQLYNACQFVIEKEINYHYRDAKQTSVDAEMEETYHILGLHFWGNLRNRLYEYNRTGIKDFYKAVATDQQNMAYTVHSLQKTYTERYGWQSTTLIDNNQQGLQCELATSQSKLALLRQIMSYAPKWQCQDQEPGRERG